MKAPRRNVASLLEQGGEGEPQGVRDRELVAENAWPLRHPLAVIKLCDHVEDKADSEVGEDHAVPSDHGQRGHEPENARVDLFGFVDHDGDSEVEVGFGKVDDPLPLCRDGEGGDRDIRFLQ